MDHKEVDSHACQGFDSSDEEEAIDLSPFIISWLPLTNGDEKLGISGLPGKKFKETWRCLENDLKCLTTANVDEIFSLCTKGELSKYRVPELLNGLTEAGILVHHYPFPDGLAPGMGALIKMIDEIKVANQNGKLPMVHCYGGLGRSCLVAACSMLMMDESLKPETAIEKVRALRGPGAIQSVKQYNFVCEFRQLYAEYKKENEVELRSVSR